MNDTWKALIEPSDRSCHNCHYWTNVTGPLVVACPDMAGCFWEHGSGEYLKDWIWDQKTK